MSDDTDSVVCAQTGKIRYRSRHAARDAAMGLNARTKRSKGIARPYLCSDCGAWHIGRERRRRRPR